MLKSIIKENASSKFIIDRVTNKKNPFYYNMFFSIILIILLFFTFFLIQISQSKQIKILNTFLINNGFTIKNIEILGIKNIPKETVVQIVNAESKSNIFNVN